MTAEDIKYLAHDRTPPSDEQLVESYLASENN